jgi:predicted GH43/DUF377 family glycosyl hydrolase
MKSSTPISPRGRRICFSQGLVRILLLVLAAAFRPAEAPGAEAIDAATMERVYREVRTPYKYGIVLRGASNQMVDCPSLFCHNGSWYMLYVAIADKIGYETFLARSEDLVNWRTLGKVLSFAGKGWDAWQADGGAALVDTRWGGSAGMGRYKGKYWMSYLGGARQGYEPDPLSIGIAWTRDPTQAVEWSRAKENPVLTPCDPDVREFERLTLYKSTIIRDDARSLGAPFVMFYNAKVKNGYERIGMALSKDMVHWSRFGPNCVLANGEDRQNGISGDPQIVRMNDLWVMFYFGAGWKPKAFDTFAVSRDLVHWTRWEGPHLVEPSEPWDETYAHKPWVLKHEGVVYHFYCAVGSEGRVIALATSRDLRGAR